MKRVKTSAGFEAELDEAVFDDLELIDALTALQGGELTALPVVTDKLLGGEKPRLYDFVRDERGRVPVKAAADILMEIIEALSPKNA